MSMLASDAELLALRQSADPLRVATDMAGLLQPCCKWPSWFIPNARVFALIPVDSLKSVINACRVMDTVGDQENQSI